MEQISVIHMRLCVMANVMIDMIHSRFKKGCMPYYRIRIILRIYSYTISIPCVARIAGMHTTPDI